MKWSPTKWSQGIIWRLNLGFDAALVAGIIAGWGALRGDAVPWWTLLLAIAVWAFGSIVIRYYDPWTNRGAIDELALTSLLLSGVAAALAVSRWLIPGLGVDLSQVFLLALGPLFIAKRLLFRRLEASDRSLDEVLIVGAGTMARSTAEALESRRRARMKVKGYLSWPGERGEVGRLGAPVLGGCEELEHVLRSVPVREVYIAGDPERQGEALRAAVRVCERFGVPFALPAFPVRLDRARPAEPRLVADGYLHFLGHEPRPHQRALKRLFDIAASATALLLLSPLFLVVAAIIELTSKGPVFFAQERVGLNGRPFRMLKFRTMVVNAEALAAQLSHLNEQTGPVFKIKDDPRVTRFGRLLRRHSIDELPQLLNVLRGEMSVVGPRPLPTKEVKQIESWQIRRLSVKPGLTCIWQVSGRNEILFEDWMYLDMRYIDHWSFFDDLRLILRTVPMLLTGRGAS